MKARVLVSLLLTAATLCATTPTVSSSTAVLAVNEGEASPIVPAPTDQDSSLSERNREAFYLFVVKGFFDEFKGHLFNSQDNLKYVFKSYLLVLQDRKVLTRKQVRLLMKAMVVTLRAMHTRFFNQESRLKELQGSLVQHIEVSNIKATYEEYWAKRSVSETALKEELEKCKQEFEKVSTDFLQIFLHERGAFLTFLLSRSLCSIGIEEVPDKASFLEEFEKYLQRLQTLGYVGAAEVKLFMMSIFRFGEVNSELSVQDFIKRMQKVIERIRDNSAVLKVINNYINYFDDVKVQNLPMFSKNFEQYLDAMNRRIEPFRKKILFDSVRKLMKHASRRTTLKHVLRSLKRLLRHSFHPEIHFVISLKRYGRSIGSHSLSFLLSYFQAYCEDLKRFCVVDDTLIETMQTKLRVVTAHQKSLSTAASVEEENEKGIHYVIESRRLAGKEPAKSWTEGAGNWRSVFGLASSKRLRTRNQIRKLLLPKSSEFTRHTMNFLMLNKSFFKQVKTHSRSFWMRLRERQFLRPYTVSFLLTCLNKLAMKKAVDLKSISSVQLVMGRFMDQLKIPKSDQKILMGGILKLTAGGFVSKSQTKLNLSIGKYEDKAMEKVNSFLNTQAEVGMADLKKVRSEGKFNLGLSLARFAEYYRQKAESPRLFVRNYLNDHMRTGLRRRTIVKMTMGKWVDRLTGGSMIKPRGSIFAAVSLGQESALMRSSLRSGMMIGKYRERPFGGRKPFGVKTLASLYLLHCGDMKFRSFGKFLKFFGRFVEKVAPNERKPVETVGTQARGFLRAHFVGGQLNFARLFSKTRDIPPQISKGEGKKITFKQFLEMSAFRSRGELKRLMARFIDSARPFVTPKQGSVPSRAFLSLAQQFLSQGKFNYNRLFEKTRDRSPTITSSGASSAYVALQAHGPKTLKARARLSGFMARFEDMATRPLHRIFGAQVKFAEFKRHRFSSEEKARMFFARAVDKVPFLTQKEKIEMKAMFVLLKPCFRNGRFSYSRFIHRYRDVLPPSSSSANRHSEASFASTIRASKARSFATLNRLFGRIEDRIQGKAAKIFAAMGIESHQQWVAQRSRESMAHVFLAYRDRIPSGKKGEALRAAWAETLRFRSHRKSGRFHILMERYREKFQRSKLQDRGFSAQVMAQLRAAVKQKGFSFTHFFVKIREKMAKLSGGSFSGQGVSEMRPAAVLKSLSQLRGILSAFADSTTVAMPKVLEKHASRAWTSSFRRSHRESLGLTLVKLQDKFVRREKRYYKIGQALLASRNPVSQLSRSRFQHIMIKMRSKPYTLARPDIVLAHWLQTGGERAKFASRRIYRRFFSAYLDVWRNSGLMSPAEKGQFLMRIFTPENLRGHRFKSNKVLAKMRLNFLPIGSKQTIFKRASELLPGFSATSTLTKKAKKILVKAKLELVKPPLLAVDLKHSLASQLAASGKGAENLHKFFDGMSRLRLRFAPVFGDTGFKRSREIARRFGLFPHSAPAKLFAEMLARTVYKENLSDDVRAFGFFAALKTTPSLNSALKSSGMMKKAKLNEWLNWSDPAFRYNHAYQNAAMSDSVNNFRGFAKTAYKTNLQNAYKMLAHQRKYPAKSGGPFYLRGAQRLSKTMLKSTYYRNKRLIRKRKYLGSAQKSGGAYGNRLSKMALKVAYLANVNLNSKLAFSVMKAIDSKLLRLYQSGFSKILLKEASKNKDKMLKHSSALIKLMAKVSTGPFQGFKKVLLKSIDLKAKKLEKKLKKLGSFLGSWAKLSKTLGRIKLKSWTGLPLKLKRLRYPRAQTIGISRGYTGNSMKIKIKQVFSDYLEEKFIKRLKKAYGGQVVSHLVSLAPQMKKMKLKEVVGAFNSELLKFKRIDKPKGARSQSVAAEFARSIAKKGFAAEQNFYEDPTAVEADVEKALFASIRHRTIKPLVDVVAKKFKKGPEAKEACCCESWDTVGNCDCEERARVVENDLKIVERAENIVNIEPEVHLKISVAGIGLLSEVVLDSGEVPLERYEPKRAREFI